jgi:hypothetical protein
MRWEVAPAASNARWWRPTYSLSPTLTCSKSEASKQGRPISCAATRKLRTFSKYWNADSALPSGCSTESAAVFTTTCKAHARAYGQCHTTVATAGGRRKKKRINEHNVGACLGDGARVDSVERAAEDLAVTEAEAELLLGRLLREVARGDRPHRAAQPPRRLVPPRRCTHQTQTQNQIQKMPPARTRPKSRNDTSQEDARTAPASSALREARSRSLRRHPCCRSTSSTTAAAESERTAAATSAMPALLPLPCARLARFEMDGGIKLPRSPLMGRCLCFLRGGFVGRGGYNGGGGVGALWRARSLAFLSAVRV